MKVVFLWFIVLSSLSLLADDTRSLDAFISTVDHINGDAQAEQIYCNESHGGGSLEERQNMTFIDNCMKDICGNPNENPTDILTNESINAYVESKDIPEIEEMEEALENALKAEKDKNQVFLTKAREMLANNSFAEGLDNLPPHEWERLTHQIYSPFITMIVNPNTTNPEKKLRIKIKREYEGQINEQLRGQILAYAEGIKTQALSGVWHTQLTHRVLPLDEARKVFEENYQRIKTEIRNELDNDSFFSRFFQDEEDAILADLEEKMENSEDLTYPEIIQLMGRLRNFQHMVMGEKINEPSFCQSGPCRDGVLELLSNLDYGKMLNEIERSNNTKGLEGIKRDCRTQIIADQILTPDIDMIREQLPKVWNNYEKNVLVHFSDHSKETFKNALREQVQFTYTDNEANGESTAIKLRDTFERKENFAELQTQEEFVSRIKQADIYSWMISKNQNLGLDAQGRSQFRGDAFADFNPCDQSRPNVGGDRFEAYNEEEVPSRPYRIHMSNHTCRHVQSGAGTIAHEMGHLMSTLFVRGKLSTESRTLYEKIRTCSNLGYKNIEPFADVGPGQFEGDTYKSEEDTADLISMMAMQHETENRPHTCRLLNPTENGSHYQHSTLIRYEGNHSAPPLRVINEFIHRRQPLPSSCRYVTELYKDELRFGRCF